MSYETNIFIVPNNFQYMCNEKVKLLINNHFIAARIYVLILPSKYVDFKILSVFKAV